MEMGLMSTFNESKKTFFTAEKPGRLLDFLKGQEEESKRKIQILEERMPELRSLMSSVDKPTVKYYEGIEGLRAVQNDFIETLSEGDIIKTFLPYDDFERSNLTTRFTETVKKRLLKKIRMRILYTSKEGRQWEHEKKERANLKEYKFIDYKKYPFNGGMNIYGDKIFMIDYLGKTGGIVIENKTLAKMMESLFELAWNLSE
jgi:sugar-specific transcriptional regulator TrmB